MCFLVLDRDNLTGLSLLILNGMSMYMSQVSLEDKACVKYNSAFWINVCIITYGFVEKVMRTQSRDNIYHVRSLCMYLHVCIRL